MKGEEKEEKNQTTKIDLIEVEAETARAIEEDQSHLENMWIQLIDHLPKATEITTEVTQEDPQDQNQEIKIEAKVELTTEKDLKVVTTEGVAKTAEIILDQEGKRTTEKDSTNTMKKTGTHRKITLNAIIANFWKKITNITSINVIL